MPVDVSRGLPRVLAVHNFYRWRGGEDVVVESEIDLLRRRGHAVELFTRHNDDLDERHPVALALDTVWSRRAAAALAQDIERFRPDLLHVHNTFPAISPAILWTARRHGVPVVQTLHNFRLLCAQANFLRAGAPCEDCLGRLPWRGVIRRCYRGSTAASAALVAMIGTHRALGTWERTVGRYIALTEFSRSRYVAGGLPADRIAVKPNFVDLPPPEPGVSRRGGLFVGRLSGEKGVAVLAAAAARTPGVEIELFGEGPLADSLRGLPGLALRGAQPPEAVYSAMRRACYLVLPSTGYEGFPRVVAEAFACGLPVIGSRLGALPELIEEGRTGLLVEPGSASDLASRLAWANGNPAALAAMGDAARRVYETRYTGVENYRQLAVIYREASATGARA